MSTQQQLIEALSTEHLQTDLKSRSLRGGVLTVTSQGTQFLIQSVSTVMLARLLTPTDFGLLAMVATITIVGQSFADLGLDQATIQREDVSGDQVSTLFWVNLGIGLSFTLLTAALAPGLAWFYHEPRLTTITLAVSVVFLLASLRVQHDALLKRQMRFKALVFRDVGAYVVAVSTAIILALHGAGYWALVAHAVTMELSRTTFSWLLVRWIPGPPRRGAKVGTLIAFGSNIAASSLINTAVTSAANVLIGSRWGAGPLGLYSRAYNLLMLPVKQLAGPVRSTALPSFSRIQGDPPRFARYYLRCVNLITWIGAPLFGFLFVAAEPVIILTLGYKWREAAPVFQILVVSAMAQLLLDSTTWLLVSRGQSGRLLRLWCTISPIMVVSFAAGVPFGIKGVALFGSLVMVAAFPWILKFTFHGTQVTLRLFGQAILWPISICLAGVVFAELTLRLSGPRAAIWQVLIVALTFAVIYLVSAVIPPIRLEISSLRDLLKHLQWSQQVT